MSAERSAAWPRWDEVKGESAQKILLYRALRATGFNRSRAGRLVGLSRETIRQKLASYGGEPGLRAFVDRIQPGGISSPSTARALGAAYPVGSANTASADGAAKPQHGDKWIPANHLQGEELLPRLTDDMSSAAASLAEKRGEPRTAVRLAGRSREFAVLGGAMLKNRMGGQVGASEFVSLVLEDIANHNGLAEYVEKLLDRRSTEGEE